MASLGKILRGGAAAVGKKLGQLLQTPTSPGEIPLEIELVPLSGRWKQPEIIEGWSTELLSLGFRAAGDFELPILGGTRIRGFEHSKGYLAAACEAAQVEPFSRSLYRPSRRHRAHRLDEHPDLPPASGLETNTVSSWRIPTSVAATPGGRAS